MLNDYYNYLKGWIKMGLAVSIIIPVYNGENSISISLDSLLNQTYSNFEVIIIDDGSKDSTAKVIERYKKRDSRFKYFFQQNAGVAIARNKGLEIAEGEYICFLDSDDYYEETFIEKMYEKIKVKKADVCYCGYNAVTPSRVFKKKSVFKEGKILVDYILGKVSVHTTGWIIKRELLERYNICFPKGVSWGEDFEFFCEVLSRTDSVCFVKEYLTNYRIDFDENQLSAFSMDKLDKDFNSIKRIKNNKIVNTSQSVSSALINYRLSALLTYRLLEAIKIGVDRKVISNYYDKYKKHLTKTSWNNGLRSLKLNLNRIRLKNKIKKS